MVAPCTRRRRRRVAAAAAAAAAAGCHRCRHTARWHFGAAAVILAVEQSRCAGSSAAPGRSPPSSQMSSLKQRVLYSQQPPGSDGGFPPCPPPARARARAHRDTGVYDKRTAATSTRRLVLHRPGRLLPPQPPSARRCRRCRPALSLVIELFFKTILRRHARARPRLVTATARARCRVIWTRERGNRGVGARALRNHGHRRERACDGHG